MSRPPTDKDIADELGEVDALLSGAFKAGVSRRNLYELIEKARTKIRDCCKCLRERRVDYRE